MGRRAPRVRRARCPRATGDAQENPLPGPIATLLLALSGSANSLIQGWSRSGYGRARRGRDDALAARLYGWSDLVGFGCVSVKGNADWLRRLGGAWVF